MKTISPIFIALILFTTVCFGQTTTDTTTSKNFIVIKLKKLAITPTDARKIDGILSRCKNIYSSQTSSETGICKIVADKTITYETISKYISDKGYTFEPVSIEPATAKDTEQFLHSNNK